MAENQVLVLIWKRDAMDSSVRGGSGLCTVWPRNGSFPGRAYEHGTDAAVRPRGARLSSRRRAGDEVSVETRSGETKEPGRPGANGKTVAFSRDRVRFPSLPRVLQWRVTFARPGGSGAIGGSELPARQPGAASRKRRRVSDLGAPLMKTRRGRPVPVRSRKCCPRSASGISDAARAKRSGSAG